MGHTKASIRSRREHHHYNMLKRFKDEHAFEKRVEEADKIRKKHADRIPVICEKAEGSDIPEIDRKKYLVPQELTVGQFVYVVRKRLRLPPEKVIYPTPPTNSCSLW